MKELLVAGAIITAIIAIVIGNIFPQYDNICGWVMISALVALVCIVIFYDEDDK